MNNDRPAQIDVPYADWVSLFGIPGVVFVYDLSRPVRVFVCGGGSIIDACICCALGIESAWLFCQDYLNVS